jgi:hypothetical protein
MHFICNSVYNIHLAYFYAIKREEWKVKVIIHAVKRTECRVEMLFPSATLSA